jgi:Uma2 family endonuclease
MALTASKVPVPSLTYEEYLAEAEVNRRYDIIEGVRRFMASPTWQHQRIADKMTRALLAFEESSGAGMALSAPFDVLIERLPLRTRQPDVLFISQEQLAVAGGVPERGVLEVAPELVVEVLSESDRQQVLDEKLADYALIGVREAWLVLPEEKQVQVMQLTTGGPVLAATYDTAGTVRSLTFPDLMVPVVALFP